MKSLKAGILSMALLMGAVSPGFAFIGAPYVMVEQDANKVEIGMKELPATVVKDIKTRYENAEFVSAVKETTKDGKALSYKVMLKQDGKDVVLKYNGEGQLIEK